MKRARFLVVLTLASVLAARSAAAQRAVFVVRHAEKQIDSNDASVPLSEAGRARAKRLAAVLGNAGVTAIYSTDTVRTLGTAEPLAQERKIAVRKYSSTAAGGKTTLRPLAARLRSEHPRDVVLVIGHSDTVPLLLDALGCAEKIEIPSGQFDDLFAVVPGTHGHATLLRLTY